MTTNSNSFRNGLWVLAEKAFWTWVQVFATVVAMSESIDASVAQSALVAAVAAALTVVANGLPSVPTFNLNPGVDVAYRAVRTFAVAFIPILAAIPVLDWNVDLLKGALLMAGPPVFAVLKGYAATKVGNGDTAALLPASLDRRSFDGTFG